VHTLSALFRAPGSKADLSSRGSSRIQARRVRREEQNGRSRKRRVTIRIDEETLYYFSDLCDETGIPYQTLINLYLQDCVDRERKIDLSWYASRQLADD
jgi:predicted DNA binding CopG/RHH family protein